MLFQWMCLLSTITLLLGLWGPTWANTLPAYDVEDLAETTLTPLTLKAHLAKKTALPLSFEEVLRLASGENIEIKIDEITTQQKKVDYYLTLSELLPDITPSYGHSRFVGGIQIFGNTTINIFRTSITPQILGEYTIYPTGKNLFEIKASRHRKKAQEHHLEETRQQVLTEAALGYFDLQEAYWQRAIAQQAVQEAQLEHQLNQALYKNGVGLKLNVLQAKVFLSEKERDLLDTERQVSQAAQTMSRLLNMNMGVSIVPRSLDIILPKTIPSHWNVTDMADYAKRNHPQIKQLAQTVKATKADAWVTVMDYFPTIDLSTYINWTGGRYNQLENGRFGGIQIQTKMFTNLGTKLPLDIKRARSASKLSSLSFSQAERLIEESINNTLVELETRQAQIDVAREGLQYAQEGYHHAYGRRKAGVGSTIDLENAQTRLTQARSNVATSFLAYHKTYVKLLSYLGKVNIDNLVTGLSDKEHP